LARGRKPLPDAVKAAKGNPGKRRLVSMAEEPAAALKTPEFLTGAEERRVFRLVCDELVQRRFVRETDVNGLARWASYMAKWIRATKDLGKKRSYYETASRHGKMLRVHPLHVIIRDMERLLIPLEDRLGLNPAARQTIIRGMMMPAGQGTLFPEPVKPETSPEQLVDPSAVQPAHADALGFLAQASKAKH
jgi:P27 family predicted phage terminase small subunit